MPTPAYSCSKTFSGYPCCHRQWRHQGHCRFVHGYSRSFSFWFRAHELDDCGFVVDFSSLKQLEARLADQFDHTFLANADDPLLSTWRQLHDQGALDLRVMANVGMEASAELVWGWANELLHGRESGHTTTPPAAAAGRWRRGKTRKMPPVLKPCRRGSNPDIKPAMTGPGERGS
jgi:6-pyruvoyltetrahydropterin/6-carboxytetrahydropterin synthase